MEVNTKMFFTFVATSMIILFVLFKKTRKGEVLPPSPRGLPLIGHMHLLGPIPHQAFHKLSAKYGPLVHIYIGSTPCVIASTPEVAKEILKQNEPNFLNRPKVANLDYLTYNSSDFATVYYGPHWKFMKKLCMTELLGSRTLEQFLPIRREEIVRFLKAVYQNSEAGQEVDVGAELMRLTNNIITRMCVSTRCSDSANEADYVRKLVKELNQLGSKFNLSESFWFLKKLDLQGFESRLKIARDRYDETMERIMKEHEDARRKKMEIGEGSDDTVKDMLDILFDIYEDVNAEIRLTRENIKAFIMNIFGAGTDTSSITTEWALAELINSPSAMNKVRQEIDTVVGHNKLVQESDITNLPYLQAVVKETLRLHPTGPLIVREALEDCTISGYKVPGKTRTIVNVWSLGRDPDYWENPLEFKPERFIGEEWRSKSNFIDVRGQNFQLLPFGSGRRSCPGASFALLFVPTTLAAMIQCFEWNVTGGGGVTMEEGPGLTLPRARSLVCLPKARVSLQLLDDQSS